MNTTTTDTLTLFVSTHIYLSTNCKQFDLFFPLNK